MTSLLVVAAVSTGVEVAHANFADTCEGNSANGYICNLQGTIPSPGSISVTFTADTGNEVADVSWTVSCTDSTDPTGKSQSGATDGPTPLDVQLSPLPPTADGQCTVSASGTLPSTDPVRVEFSGVLNYTPASASPTPSPTPTPTSTSSSSGAPVHPVKGYAGKCVDDNRNSSANRAKVQIWTCSGSDQAESWTYRNDELIHNGKCLNDQHAGGNGSHVILYTCNGASNERWTSMANHELVLKARGGTLCLDDPAYSTRNGTQLIVYTCKDSSNQRWYVP